MSTKQAAKKPQMQRDLTPVVDCIRGIKRDDVNLGDVLTLAEVMVGSMRSFFGTLDTAVYTELTGIADFIESAKTEISALQPGSIKAKHIPQAGKELDAIVEATEQATDTIMERAELIMAADPSDADAYQITIQSAVMDIFEACSFQDITGQRISKVIDTLNHIEDRIGRLAETLGSQLEETEEPETTEERRRRELLLHGPALAGEGVGQSEIDALINIDATAKTEIKSQDSAPEEPVVKEVVAKAPAEEAINQADIDSLFD